MDRNEFRRMCEAFHERCANPAARYKIETRYLGVPREAPSLAASREAFLSSDVVEQLSREQSPEGNWGPLFNKDYNDKAIFPTTRVAIERCLYLGLARDDREILSSALAYLEPYLFGQGAEPLYDRNERAIPWQMCEIVELIEKIAPSNPLCDRLYFEWIYVAGRAFEGGEYGYERERDAQREILGTREKRLVPMPVGMLLLRRDALPDGLEEAMRRHYARNAFQNGIFWQKSLSRFPERFAYPYTRRWLPTIRYINRFRDAREYMEPAVDWLMRSRSADGVWDYGPQVKDPWGYFENFSLSRRYAENRIVDCTMEALDILHQYLTNRSESTGSRPNPATTFDTP